MSETKKKNRKGKDKRRYSTRDLDSSSDEEESRKSGITRAEQMNMLASAGINLNNSVIEFESSDEKRYQKRTLASRYIISEEIRFFVLSSTEDRCAHLESLFSKHTKYLLKITQQIIQSRRIKKVSIALKRILKNVTEWFDSDCHIILTKYITDHQEYTNNDTDKDRYKLIN